MTPRQKLEQRLDRHCDAARRQHVPEISRVSDLAATCAIQWAVDNPDEWIAGLLKTEEILG